MSVGVWKSQIIMQNAERQFQLQKLALSWALLFFISVYSTSLKIYSSPQNVMEYSMSISKYTLSPHASPL